MSSFQNIADAIAWTVYAPPTPIGAQIGPRTTLAAPSLIGDDHITITALLAPDGRSRICEGGVLSFRDNTGEEELPIASVTGTTVKFDFAGLGYTGLQHAHAGGSIVSSNVYGWIPWDIAAMLNTGDPVVFITPLKKGSPVSMMQGGLPTYTMRIQYHRQLFRQGQSRMNEDAWSRRMLQGTWTDLDAIEAALLQNNKLNTDVAGPFATKLGAIGSSADLLTWFLDKTEVEKDTWQYVAAADLIVTGTREPIG